jgi:putative RNA 2'-phosphotransferase
MMNEKQEQKLSKFMSLILRHTPEKFGLKLEIDGSCTIDELVNTINAQSNWTGITNDNIHQVAKNCPKQRYKIEGDRIKANYGHSLEVPRVEKIPPDVLYHGTNTKVIDLIMKDGIKRQQRDIHMSEGTEFATLSGQRRGKLVIVKIDAKTASNDGVKFYYAAHDVWLADFIPQQYLTREEE